MKQLHRPDLFGWSAFQEPLDLDFNSLLWRRQGGNVLIDPLAMSAHDLEHAKQLGGAAWIALTNSFHVRATAELAKTFGAKVAAPRAEKEEFPVPVEKWLGDGDELVPGLRALELHGSKTPGELAFVLGDTLICGDLVRAHRADHLQLLAEDKLQSKARAIASVRRLASMGPFRAVLVGDGFCAFRDAHALLQDLSRRLG